MINILGQLRSLFSPLPNLEVLHKKWSKDENREECRRRSVRILARYLPSRSSPELLDNTCTPRILLISQFIIAWPLPILSNHAFVVHVPAASVTTMT